MDALLPIFEREGIRLNLEAHPDDFIEQNTPAVDLVRGIDSPGVGYVFCMPHTYSPRRRHRGDDPLRRAGPGPGPRGRRPEPTAPRRACCYIVNPPGSTARVHQHLDIGQGEVDFGAGFDALRAIGFDGIVTSCVFAWEERAIESSRLMYERITALLRQPAGG
jgi:myo-inositol catabolism protein IolH